MKKAAPAITSAAVAIFFIISLFTPLHPEIKPDERVIFYPAYSFVNDGGEITCNIHGHIFEPEEDSVFRKALIHSILEATEDESRGDDVFNPYLAERIKPFLYDNEGGKSVSINLNGNRFTLAESESNGHLYAAINLGSVKNFSGRKIIDFTAATEPDDRRIFSGRSLLIPRKGISVISDIDDTIKESNVPDKKELIKNTFMRKFRPVKGMPELYRRLVKKGAAFHYVSGSPWQLYGPVSVFLKEAGFPEGSMHLKYLRVKDSSIIDFIAADQLAFKVSSIEAILKDFPHRKFILIGDSGEHDPEVYTEIASVHQGSILAVFIRDVKKSGDSPERYDRLKAMKGKVIFRLFKKADKLTPLIGKIH